MTTENTGKSSANKSVRAPAEQPRAANGASLVNEADIQAIASFRYAIRRFLRFSEHAARKEHITPQQHQLLLAIKGFPNRDYATVSELAHRMQMRQHSVVGLIDRTVRIGLVRRERGTIDRREVYIFVTSEGDELLDRLTNMHRQELASMRQALNAVTV